MEDFPSHREPLAGFCAPSPPPPSLILQSSGCDFSQLACPQACLGAKPPPFYLMEPNRTVIEGSAHWEGTHNPRSGYTVVFVNSPSVLSVRGHPGADWGRRDGLPEALSLPLCPGSLPKIMGTSTLIN